MSGLISNEGGYPFAIISFCLKDEVHYSTYYMEFSIVTLDGKIFTGQNEIIGSNDRQKKCFEFRTTSFYSGLVTRGSSPERYEEVAKIYKTNIKSMKLSIHEKKSDEILDEIEVSSFD